MLNLRISSSATNRATGTLWFTWKQQECSHFIACLFRNAVPWDVPGTRGQSWRYWAEPGSHRHSDPSWIGLEPKYKYIPSKSSGNCTRTCQALSFTLLSLQVYFPQDLREAKFTPAIQEQGVCLMCCEILNSRQIEFYVEFSACHSSVILWIQSRT
jgi:hypothetical protein